MNNEISTPESNHTWVLTSFPSNKHPIGSKWVYRIKYNANGSVDKYKARLVEKGHTQQEGFDYTETFAPVAKLVTVKTILDVSSINNWPVHQLDINNAFLHDDLNEEVYIGISNLLPSFFYLASIPVMLTPLSSHITKTQRKYALDLIEYANLQNEKPAKTPLDPRVKLTYTEGEPLTDPSHYRTMVGKFIYLTISRPDLAFAAHLLSQFTQNPHTSHLQALHRVIRYIKLSPGQGLFLPRNNPSTLHAYCDNDWANCPNSMRSIIGFGIFLGNTLISWHSKKQPLISLLKDLKIFVNTPVSILCDNISTIALASNPVQHARTKQIELDCHFVRDKIKAGQIQFSYVPTKAQVADIFTKALTTYPYRQCLSKLDMCDPYTLPACGGEGGMLVYNTK
ncbi:uncharacterized mitochondrial protein-like protein [Tanacetum coccineum]